MANVDIHEVIHSLEAGSKVKLIEVDCTEFGGDILRFHNYEVPHTTEELLEYQRQGVDQIPPKPIMWKGDQYDCWPYQMDGVEMDGTGSVQRLSYKLQTLTVV